MIETSEQTTNVWSKVFKVQEKELSVVKTAANAAFKQNGKTSRYADINSILSVVTPELNAVKLVTVFMLTGDKLFMQVTDIESGEWLRFACQLNLTGQTAQQIGSQITYYRRYMLNGFFNLQAEDDDGNLTSGVTQSYQAATPVTVTKVTKKVEIGNAAHAELKTELLKMEKCKYRSAEDIRKDYEVSDAIMGEIKKGYSFIK